MKLPFATGGSGSVFIAGLLHGKFQKAMSKYEPRALANKQACSHAICRDGSSGSAIQTVVINSEGVDRYYTSGNETRWGLLTGNELMSNGGSSMLALMAGFGMISL